MRITMLQLQYKLINYNNIITIKSSLTYLQNLRQQTAY